jgi:hypothetical protein
MLNTGTTVQNGRSEGPRFAFSVHIPSAYPNSVPSLSPQGMYGGLVDSKLSKFF